MRSKYVYDSPEEKLKKGDNAIRILNWPPYYFKNGSKERFTKRDFQCFSSSVLDPFQRFSLRRDDVSPAQLVLMTMDGCMVMPSRLLLLRMRFTTNRVAAATPEIHCTGVVGRIRRGGICTVRPAKAVSKSNLKRTRQLSIERSTLMVSMLDHIAGGVKKTFPIESWARTT